MKKYLLTIFNSKTRDGAWKPTFETTTSTESKGAKLMNQPFGESKAEVLPPRKKKIHPFIIHS
jgi:hypothetical protein